MRTGLTSTLGNAALMQGDRVPHRSTALRSQTPPYPADCMRMPRVIVADDDAVFRTSLTDLLSCKGYQSIVTCSNGRDLLRKLMEDRFDLLLLDLHMPDIDGLQVLETMRRMGEEVAVIVISGDTLIESAVGALQLGASDYVRKPYIPEVLLHTIESTLRRCELESRQRKLALNLERSERMHRFLVDTSPDLIFTLDEQRVITFANERVARTLGVQPGELVGKAFLSIVFEDDIERVGYTLDRAENQECSAELRFDCTNSDTVRHFEVQFMPVNLSENLPSGAISPRSGVYVLARDISERRRANDRLAYLAYHDILTGLPNRELFRDRVGLSIIQARRSGMQLAIMFVDLDRFKLINDTYGHQQGDALLKEVASRLQGGLREVDTLARIGGDEFTVLLPGLRSRDNVVCVARKLIEIMDRPFMIEGHTMFVSASIGVALYPDDGSDIETLMRHADIALYHVKSHGKNDFVFFAGSMGEVSSRRLSIENEIRLAIEEQQLELFYQVQVDTRTHRKVGLEALIRWNHPLKGLVSAGGFIPVAEEIGLMPEITLWVLETACRDLRNWWDEGLGIERISINVSPCVLETEEFLVRLFDALDRYRIPYRNFEIEVTENTFIGDRGSVADCLRQISARGIRVAIDDFGTQYSSLSYLRHLPINTLKIDQSFVREIESINDVSPIMCAIIGIAEGLGLNVVAEGVETEIQAQFLHRLGCHEMQGFLFGRPASVATLRETLAPLDRLVWTAGELPFLPPARSPQVTTEIAS